MDKTTLIIGIVILIIIIILIVNLVMIHQTNESNAHESFNTQNQSNPTTMRCQSNSNSNNQPNQLNLPNQTNLSYQGQVAPTNLINQNNNGDKLTLYYTEWCGASQQFKPIWDQFCNQNKTGVQTITIDCDKNSGICQQQSIRGYPTVLLHKQNGQNIEFMHQRTVDNLNNFVNQNKTK